MSDQAPYTGRQWVGVARLDAAAATAPQHRFVTTRNRPPASARILAFAPRPKVAPKVLLIEDDRALAGSLRQGLQEDGFRVELAPTVAAGFRVVLAGTFELLVIDVDLPDGDGIDLARTLRTQGIDAPILMLTGHGLAESMVRGLDAGADDYIVKPVGLDVLGARLRAAHRRWQRPTEAPIRVGDLTLEPSRLIARRGAFEIDLTPAQVGVLQALMTNAGNALTRSQISRHLHHDDDDGDVFSNVIDVHVRALRAKIDEPFGRHSIETVRGIGYRMLRGAD